MNRKILFDRLRAKPFRGVLTQGQVDGINAILDAWERHYRQRTSIAQLSYCCGTTYHETAGTMLPIKEYGDTAYFMRMYDKTGERPHVAATLGNTEVGDGAKFCGRGLPQLTGRTNYRNATAKLRELGFIGVDVDFEADPDLVMRPDLACHIMFAGMEEGWFTGARLDTIIDDVVDGDEHADFINARKIINGKDRAEKIAGNADDFLAALVAADQAREGEVLDPIRNLPSTEQAGQDQKLASFLTMFRWAMGTPEIRALVEPILIQKLGLKFAAPPAAPAPAAPPAGQPASVKASAWAFAGGALLQILGIAPPPEVIGPILGAGTPPTTAGTLTTVLPILAGIVGKFGGFSPIAGFASKIGGSVLEMVLANRAAKTRAGNS